MSLNPLELPELLDQCIHHLDANSDLSACAAVARSWAYPAQSALYRAPLYTKRLADLPGPQRRARLMSTLLNSSHLVSFVRYLHFCPDTEPDICHVAFPRLEGIETDHFTLTDSVAVGLHQLFSLPTVRDVSLFCQIPKPAAFLRVWERVSPTITAIDLHCYDGHHGPLSTGAAVVPHRHTVQIPLKALRIKGGAQISTLWFQDRNCVFDLSELKCLILATYEHVLQWRTLIPAFETIEMLDLGLLQGAVDLSAFTSLHTLRARSLQFSMILDVLATIPSTNRLRNVYLGARAGPENIEDFRSLLSRRAFPHLKEVDLLWRSDLMDVPLPQLPNIKVKVVKAEGAFGVHPRLPTCYTTL
ncbi:hypothetical protein FB45DRAFT_222452 [Roridomyces roridus]|uniref:F-box domain-containing protein n=1 Tax=Roridomyces roridus TaxID=1738132 RepID=A0AAD7FD66_9AGAR|nr:hypothetical protein FB45DRAFT_222452 [Roridomyces roridus]